SLTCLPCPVRHRARRQGGADAGQDGGDPAGGALAVRGQRGERQGAAHPEGVGEAAAGEGDCFFQALGPPEADLRARPGPRAQDAFQPSSMRVRRRRAFCASKWSCFGSRLARTWRRVLRITNCWATEKESSVGSRYEATSCI